jgi:hypothetical protein
METKMQEQIKAAALSYGRAAAAAVAALYMAGVTDPRTLSNAFIAALIGPILKAVDPKAKEFGVGKK